MGVFFLSSDINTLSSSWHRGLVANCACTIGSSLQLCVQASYGVELEKPSRAKSRRWT